MSRNQQREQEVGFLAVLCGGVSFAVCWFAFVLVHLLVERFGFLLGFSIAVVVGLLVTLVAGTVLLRALRKGNDEQQRLKRHYDETVVREMRREQRMN